MQSMWMSSEFKGNMCFHCFTVHSFVVSPTVPVTFVSDRAAQRTNTKTRISRKRGERHRESEKTLSVLISTVYVKNDVHMQYAVCCCSVLFQYNLSSAHSETDSEQLSQSSTTGTIGIMSNFS